MRLYGKYRAYTVSGLACRKGAVVKKSITDRQREELGPHRPSRLFLLRVWIEKKNDGHGREDLAGKLQDPLSSEVQYFNGAMELVRILRRTIYWKETAGSAADADSGQA